MNGNSSDGDFNLPDNRFRSNLAALKEEIKSLKRKNSDMWGRCLYQICVDVEEKILGFDDPNLSCLQNKVRKIDAGSDLFREICLIQLHLSNLEISKGVSEVLDHEKYENISKNIKSRKDFEMKRERFFLKEALKTITDTTAGKRGEKRVEATLPEAEGLENLNLQSENEQISENLEVSGPETARLVNQEMEDAEIENMRMSSFRKTQMAELSMPGDITVPDIMGRNLDQESELMIDLNELERLLEEGIEIPEEGITQINEVSENREPVNGHADLSDDLDELPPVTESPAKRRKRQKPVYDDRNQIKNYSERARKLNKKNCVKRVQVFEGPPSFVNALKLNNLFATPAVNNGLSGFVTSSVLQQLYKRHQITAEKPHWELRDSLRQRAGTVAGGPSVSEEVAPRQGSRFQPQKSQLVDVSGLQGQGPEGRESAVARDNTIEARLERIVGSPVSRIPERETMPPPVGVAEPSLPIQLLGDSSVPGKTLEEPATEPRFEPVELPVPSEKWREFKYVRRCLEEILKEKEERGSVKGATLREILERENEWSKENMLTLLRIVDKMSLRREVVVKGHGISVIIHPFEMPFVSEKQFSLRGQSPRF